MTEDQNSDGTIRVTVDIGELSAAEAESLVARIKSDGPDYRRFDSTYFLTANGTLEICEHDPREGTHHHRPVDPAHIDS